MSEETKRYVRSLVTAYVITIILIVAGLAAVSYGITRLFNWHWYTGVLVYVLLLIGWLLPKKPKK